MPADLDLNTEAGIRQALDRVRALRAGGLASADDQTWLLDVAATALRRLRPVPTPPEPDTRPVPPWLRALQEEDFDARR